MFDFDASKLLIVGVIALIFIPSKDLPRVLRQVGQFVAKARKMASEFQGQFMDAMKEADMADLRREAEKLAATARVDVGLDSMTDLKTHITSAIDGAPSAPKPRLDQMAMDQAALSQADAQPVASNTFETMDGAGMKDPNDALRRLTQSVPVAEASLKPNDPAHAESSTDEGTTAAPIAHSAL